MSQTEEVHVFKLVPDADKLEDKLAAIDKILGRCSSAWDKFEKAVSNSKALRSLGDQADYTARKLNHLHNTIQSLRGRAFTPMVTGANKAATAVGNLGVAANSTQAKLNALNTTKAQAQLTALNSKLNQTKGLMGNVVGGGGGSGRGSGGAGGVFGGLATSLHYVTAALSIMKAGFDHAYDAGKKLVHVLVEAAKERGLTMTAYEIMLGSREKAGKQLSKTLDIASLTPSSNMQVVDWTKGFLTAGFQGRRLDAARAATSDIQAARGDAMAKNMQFWFTRVASQGEASNSAVNRVGAYVNARYIRENMARMLGNKVGYKEGKYDDKTDRAVREALSDHQVNSNMFEVAVQQAILRQFKQTQLGSYSKKKGIESLAGVLSNMEEIIPTFLMRLDIDEFKGIKELKRFLFDILSFFNLGTKEGKEMAKVVEDLTNELFGGLKNITKEDMSQFFQKAVVAARWLVGAVRDLWTEIGGLIKQTEKGGLSGFIEQMGDAFGRGFGRAMEAAIPGIVNAMIQATPGIIKGTVKGAIGAGTGILKGELGLVQQAGSYLNKQSAYNLFTAPTRLATQGFDAFEGWLGPKLIDGYKPLTDAQKNEQSVGAMFSGLKSYDEGGVVGGAGPIGSPQLAIVHKGEEYRGIGSHKRGWGDGGVHIGELNLHVTFGEGASFRDLLQQVLDAENQVA